MNGFDFVNRSKTTANKGFTIAGFGASLKVKC